LIVESIIERRKTDKQTDRQTDRQTDIQIYSYRYREGTTYRIIRTHTHTHTQREREAGRQAGRQHHPSLISNQ